MSLYEYIVDSLKDEKDADKKYDEMIELTASDSSLNKEEKKLISSIIETIRKDEKQHKVLLSDIKDVIDGKKVVNHNVKVRAMETGVKRDMRS